MIFSQYKCLTPKPFIIKKTPKPYENEIENVKASEDTKVIYFAPTTKVYSQSS